MLKKLLIALEVMEIKKRLEKAFPDVHFEVEMDENHEWDIWYPEDFDTKEEEKLIELLSDKNPEWYERDNKRTYVD